jgi:YidC/Oxa1 family membrane protein insertase
MDKNTLVGFGLLALLLFGYIFYEQNQKEAYLKQKTADSIANAKLHPIKAQLIDTSALAKAKDSTATLSDSLVSNAIIPETLSTIENEDLIVSLTNKGGFPKKVELKKFKTFDGKPLILFDGDKNLIDFGFKSVAGNMIHTRSLVFANQSSDKKSISFTSPEATISYSLEDKGFMLNINATPTMADKSQTISMDWNSESIMTEKDLESQKMYTQVCYNLEKDGYDFFTIKEKESKEFKEGVKWLSFKQHYFNTTLIPDAKIITSGIVKAEPSKADTSLHRLSDFGASLTMAPQNDLKFKMFLGPNDYKLLKSYNQDLEEIIPLSYGIFGFVKYINTWLILPIFYGLAKFFSSYGIVILLLTFIIRLLMSPFTYKSYVSSAKMKALKPELDELREKLGDDKQAFGVEQMKLYRQAGVNPLGGCLPALLQLPVFFALLSFFPQAIQLRQEKFLWAKDLSTYDSILTLPFSIPFYGDHVSLFTILFVITSLLMALYSMNMAADQSNPMMKYLPFIMPVMFLGIFNKLPASLTFYYFVSNAITLALQFVIQKWIIDPDKIHAQIQAKKNEPPKENKLMKRMMEMQEQNQDRMKKGGKK